MSSAAFLQYSPTKVNMLPVEMTEREREREVQRNNCKYKNRKTDSFCVFCSSGKVAIGLHWFPSIPLWFSTSQINGRLQPFSFFSQPFFLFPFASHSNDPFFFSFGFVFLFLASQSLSFFFSTVYKLHFHFSLLPQHSTNHPYFFQVYNMNLGASLFSATTRRKQLKNKFPEINTKHSSTI